VPRVLVLGVISPGGGALSVGMLRLART
jgi:hypothetical protein